MNEVIPNEQQLTATVGQLCDAASSVVILSRGDLAEATDLVKLIKARHKLIEDERTNIVKPINDSVKRINDRFKAILTPLVEAESDIKAKMLTFQQEESRKAEAACKEAEKRAAEEQARLDAEVATMDRAPLPVAAPATVALPPETPKTTYGAFGGVSTIKKVWAYELVDISALASARPDLVTVDAARVNAEIRGRGGDIPGLRVFERETIAVR
ncbi:MAG: hypothetical protein K8U57_37050 [Planctomycetes bacterium]|nr:hypothetical protein [Planctomycetota bacterium]